MSDICRLSQGGRAARIPEGRFANRPLHKTGSRYLPLGQTAHSRESGTFRTTLFRARWHAHEASGRLPQHDRIQFYLRYGAGSYSIANGHDFAIHDGKAPIRGNQDAADGWQGRIEGLGLRIIAG